MDFLKERGLRTGTRETKSLHLTLGLFDSLLMDV